MQINMKLYEELHEQKVSNSRLNWKLVRSFSVLQLRELQVQSQPVPLYSQSKNFNFEVKVWFAAVVNFCPRS